MSSHPGVVSSVLTTAGVGSLTIHHNLSGIIWRVRQMAISSTPAGLLTLQTMFNGLPMMTPVTVFSGTAADGDPSIDIGDHDTITVAVTNGPGLANVQLAYYFEELINVQTLGTA